MKLDREASMMRSPKMAFLICLGFIGGFCWLLQKVDKPPVDMTSPLMACAVPLSFTREAQAADGGADWRAELARQFGRPSAVDAGLASVGDASEVALAASPAEPLPNQYLAPPLPPLLYAEPGPLAAIDQTTTEPLATSADQAPVAAAQLDTPADSTQPVTTGWKRYRVVRGDTLTAIARREWNSSDPRLIDLLLESNPKVAARKPRGRILAGELLVLPDAATAQRVLAGKSAGPAVSVPAAAGVQTGQVQWYTVRANDTLAKIARRFLNDSHRWREIMALNRVRNPDKIVPGTRIRLPPVIRVAQR